MKLAEGELREETTGFLVWLTWLVLEVLIANGRNQEREVTNGCGWVHEIILFWGRMEPEKVQHDFHILPWHS